MGMRERIMARERVPEELDPTPVEIPGDGRIPETIQETIARMVNARLLTYQDARGEDDPVDDLKQLDEAAEEDDEELSMMTPYTVIDMPDDRPHSGLTLSEMAEHMTMEAERMATEQEPPTPPEKTTEFSSEDEKEVIGETA